MISNRSFASCQIRCRRVDDATVGDGPYARAHRVWLTPPRLIWLYRDNRHIPVGNCLLRTDGAAEASRGISGIESGWCLGIDRCWYCCLPGDQSDAVCPYLLCPISWGNSRMPGVHKPSSTYEQPHRERHSADYNIAIDPASRLVPAGHRPDRLRTIQVVTDNATILRFIERQNINTFSKSRNCFHFVDSKNYTINKNCNFALRNKIIISDVRSDSLKNRVGSVEKNMQLVIL